MVVVVVVVEVDLDVVVKGAGRNEVVIKSQFFLGLAEV